MTQKTKVKLSMAATIAGVDFKEGDEFTVTDKKVADSNEVTITKAQAKTMLNHGFIEGE